MPAPSSSKASRALEGVRVLVAEDSFHITLVIETALEAEGAMIVGVAGELRKALELAYSTKPDLAVIDLMLGGETSLPLIRELHAAGVKIVLATGFDLPPGLKSEFSGLPVLKKPYTANQLIERISSVL